MNGHAYKLGSYAALSAFKLADFNFKTTPDRPAKDEILPDNGHRNYGVNFSEPGRPSREVSKAFDALRTQKPSDFLNAGNEAMIGATA